MTCVSEVSVIKEEKGDAVLIYPEAEGFYVRNFPSGKEDALFIVFI